MSFLWHIDSKSVTEIALPKNYGKLSDLAPRLKIYLINLDIINIIINYNYNL